MRVKILLAKRIKMMQQTLNAIASIKVKENIIFVTFVFAVAFIILSQYHHEHNI